MAIMITTDMREWNKVQSIIEDVLSKTQFYFNKNIILVTIKQQLEKNNIKSSIINCSCFDILFYKAIDKLVKNNQLYVIDDIYIPSNYMSKTEEEVNLFYLTFNEYNTPVYINVDTLQKEFSLKKRDLLLTGGYLDNTNDTLKMSEISLEDITYLYHSFIKEGLKKEEAINQVLNCYQIIPLLMSDNHCITLAINKREKNNYLMRTLKRVQ